jgi:hypothetical protein
MVKLYFRGNGGPGGAVFIPGNLYIRSLNILQTIFGTRLR